MNTKQALEVPITRILELLNCQSAPKKGDQVFYYSPFRTEKSPSFHVHTGMNKWYDFGEGKGGNVLDLVCHHLKNSGEDDTVADALRWLRNMTSYIQPVTIVREFVSKKPAPKLELKRNTALVHNGLKKYVELRGISQNVAAKYSREIRVRNKETGKSFFAIGFQNEERGWELRNQQIKSCISPKAISFIRGSIPKPTEIHVFEGFFDFMTIATRNVSGQLEGDALILNSLSCVEKGLAYVKNYGYQTLRSYMDNDVAGQKATNRLNEFVRTQEGLIHRPMNKLYADHKDVNAWHMHELGLVL